MVGVPGRSQGCLTCRKRKIRCSLESPRCSQCQKSGRYCPGYGRRLIFLHSNETYSAQHKSSPGLESAQIETSRRCQTMPFTNRFALQKLNATSTRHRIIFSLFETHSKIMSALRGHENWSDMIPNLADTAESTQVAALSVAFSRRGIETGDGHYKAQGQQFYGRALKEMQLTLRCPDKRNPDDILNACILLSVYEIMECPSKNTVGYSNHLDAAIRIVEARGPESYASGIGHETFLTFRYYAALDAVLFKHTFLSKIEWKTVPFMQKPKSDLDAFLDVFVDSITLIRESERLLQLPLEDVKLSVATELIDRCWQFDSEMKQFYGSLQSRTSGPLFWHAISKDCIFTGDRSDTFAMAHLEFCSVKISVVLILYWASLTVVWSNVSKIEGLINILAAKSSEMREETDRLFRQYGIPRRRRGPDFGITARKVCQSVDFCLRDELGLRVVVTPLIMIVSALKPWIGYEPEVAWAGKKLKQIQSMGFQILQYGESKPSGAG